MVFNKSAQSFSAEVLVVIIILLFTSLFVVMIKINSIDNVKKVNNLHKDSVAESREIINGLKEKNILDSNHNLDINKLLQLQTSELRDRYNLNHDFAITFEKDGKLVKIDPLNNISCIGSSKIIVNGNECKE